MNFYPRPPRGGRPSLAPLAYATQTFLSTPSARRATPYAGAYHEQLPISIHALREEGDLHQLSLAGCVDRISIHALREEGDARPVFTTRRPRLFLSTPSARRATLTYYTTKANESISIHALREEGDLLDGVTNLTITISIHALREEGDDRLRRGRRDHAISIHALREEGDLA